MRKHSTSFQERSHTSTQNLHCPAKKPKETNLSNPRHMAHISPESHMTIACAAPPSRNLPRCPRCFDLASIPNSHLAALFGQYFGGSPALKPLHACWPHRFVGDSPSSQLYSTLSQQPARRQGRSAKQFCTTDHERAKPRVQSECRDL